jgi:arsenical pump membrane protein
MVDAVESIGALRSTHAALQWAQKSGLHTRAFVTSFIVRHRKQPVEQSATWTDPRRHTTGAHAKGLIANAVMIGVDLDPTSPSQAHWQRFSG